MTEEIKTRTAIGNFQFEAQLPNGKRLILTGYTFDDETGEDLNARLDLAAAVIDRQRFRAEIPELEARLDQHKVALTQHKDHLADLEQKAIGRKLTEQQRLTVENVSRSIKQIANEIVKGEQAIVEAKVKGGL